MNWQQNLLTNIIEIANLLNETRTIAVLGIKTEEGDYVQNSGAALPF